MPCYSGYGFEDQELREGVRRVAAPIFNADGYHVGCIGVSATMFSFDLDDVDDLGRQVLAAARNTSEEMGYRPVAIHPSNQRGAKYVRTQR